MFFAKNQPEKRHLTQDDTSHKNKNTEDKMKDKHNFTKMITLLLVIVIASMAMVSCTTNPRTETANVTINLTVSENEFIARAVEALLNISEEYFEITKDNSEDASFDAYILKERSPIGATVTLINHNNNPRNVYTIVATENSVVFADIPFGTYTLKITHDGFESYLYEAFGVNSVTLSHEAILVPEVPEPPTDRAEVTIKLIVPEDYSAIGAVVTLINHNNDPDNVYTITATENDVIFILQGMYLHVSFDQRSVQVPSDQQRAV